MSHPDTYLADKRLAQENQELRATVASMKAEFAAMLPKCCFTHECKKVGVKWIARTHLHCDIHGSQYDLDAPWAAFARKHGL